MKSTAAFLCKQMSTAVTYCIYGVPTDSGRRDPGAVRDSPSTETKSDAHRWNSFFFTPLNFASDSA